MAGPLNATSRKPSPQIRHIPSNPRAIGFGASRETEVNRCGGRFLPYFPTGLICSELLLVKGDRLLKKRLTVGWGKRASNARSFHSKEFNLLVRQDDRRGIPIARSSTTSDRSVRTERYKVSNAL